MGESLVVAVVLVVCVAYVTWTATRIDRLHVRVGAADRALAQALERRHEVADRIVAEIAARRGEAAAADVGAALALARSASTDTRESAENDLSASLRRAADDPARPPMGALVDAGAGLALARQFYNDAVRDTRAIRWHPVPRTLRLGGDRPMPAYFEIDAAPGVGTDAPRSGPDAGPTPGNTVDPTRSPPEEGT